MGNTARTFFTNKEENDIVKAIASAELDTSGEIRVHIDKDCSDDVFDRAATIFERLGMVHTRERNGVLFYLAVKPHKFAIIGDLGINSKVPPGFWESIKTQMIVHFREGNFAKGLIEGIEMAGKQLKEHFPWQKNDENELPNEISFG